jgi:hypothetical protein
VERRIQGGGVLPEMIVINTADGDILTSQSKSRCVGRQIHKIKTLRSSYLGSETLMEEYNDCKKYELSNFQRFWISTTQQVINWIS